MDFYLLLLALLAEFDIPINALLPLIGLRYLLPVLDEFITKDRVIFRVFLLTNYFMEALTNVG
jgi:hypothetical protein